MRTRLPTRSAGGAGQSPPETVSLHDEFSVAQDPLGGLRDLAEGLGQQPTTRAEQPRRVAHAPPHRPLPPLDRGADREGLETWPAYLGPALVGRSAGSLGCFPEPCDDLVVDVVGSLEFQVVHPVAFCWVHDLFESARRIVTAERDGQNDLCGGVPQVLAREPQIREAPLSSECNLALRRPNLERSDVVETRPDLLVHGGGNGVPVEKVRWFHCQILPRTLSPTAGLERQAPQAF